MREQIPRGPFDQGLFLAHLNRGRQFYDGKQLGEAERELEEAYLLRPRDLKVLNLLGLVYFKQEKLDKAEEVYRKLVAESPDSHTLYYNLGLICFKLSRLEEAETSFLKALELSRENPKISFYLGSIYERLHRFKDAIFQYRQAGANIMVRRVEDKMAQAPTDPQAGAPSPRRKERDTAEFPKKNLKEEVPQGSELADAKTVEPVSAGLLAPTGPGPTDTARFHLEENTLPPGAVTARGSRTLPGALGAAAVGMRPRPGEVFRFLENSLLEATFEGRLFIKQGTIYSYSGNLTFWVKEKRAGGRGALVIVTGNGRVILTDRDRQITLMHVGDEPLFVEPTHLLACEEGLTPRYVPLNEANAETDVVLLEGSGMLAFSAASKPLPIVVSPTMPVSVPLASVIGWTTGLSARLVEDKDVHAAMLPDGVTRPLVRLEGSGRVMVEQAPA
jgi:uncharacterized protein (AIM24 family)